jgi:hypothetical protein
MIIKAAVLVNTANFMIVEPRGFDAAETLRTFVKDYE